MRLVKAAAAALGLFLVAGLPAAAQNVPMPALLVPGPLGENAIGSPDAPVTVVEYASMTCSHCATFHNETWDALKEKYIDTGKVRFILREFPLDPLARAAFLVARCAPQEDYFELVEEMFARQPDWAFVDKPADALFALVEPHGMDRAKFEACVADAAAIDHIRKVMDRAENSFGVRGTPTFFFNGERHVGPPTIEEIDEIVDRLE